MSEAKQTLDARGLNCPLPILRTKKAMAQLGTGETLQVIATDPGSVKDLDAFCRQTGHQMLSSTEGSGEFQFMIQKS